MDQHADNNHDQNVSEDVPQQFFSLCSEGARIFGKSARTMRWWADTGRIKTVKIGSARFITEAEILRLNSDGER